MAVISRQKWSSPLLDQFPRILWSLCREPRTFRQKRGPLLLPILCGSQRHPQPASEVGEDLVGEAKHLRFREVGRAAVCSRNLPIFRPAGKGFAHAVGLQDSEM